MSSVPPSIPLTSELYSIALAADANELQERLVAAAFNLGFDRVSALTVVEEDEGLRFLTIHNMDRGFLHVYHDCARGRRDPVMQHCKSSNLPTVWGRETYASAGLLEQWELQHGHDCSFGISTAMHLRGGLHFSLGLMRGRALESKATSRARLAAQLQLLAAVTQESAIRLHSEAVRSSINLSKIERECWPAVSRPKRNTRFNESSLMADETPPAYARRPATDCPSRAWRAVVY